MYLTLIDSRQSSMKIDTDFPPFSRKCKDLQLYKKLSDSIGMSKRSPKSVKLRGSLEDMLNSYSTMDQ
jgi:hypothetical protein